VRGDDEAHAAVAAGLGHLRGNLSIAVGATEPAVDPAGRLLTSVARLGIALREMAPRIVSTLQATSCDGMIDRWDAVFDPLLAMSEAARAPLVCGSL